MAFGTTKKEPVELELTNRALALHAASESFVLLKNNGVLPFAKGCVALYGFGVVKHQIGGEV